MTDPRNIAHDKKVQQAKKHKGEDIAAGTDQTPQPGKKPHMEKHAGDAPDTADGSASDADEPASNGGTA